MSKKLRRKNKNTQKLRARIRQAIAHKRFFAYLVTAKPLLPIGIFLPWLALPAVIAADDFGFMHWFARLIKILGFVATSALFLAFIRKEYLRYLRFLRNMNF